MGFKMKSEAISRILVFTVLLLLIEITFFNGGLLISIGAAALCIYFGVKRLHKKSGVPFLLLGLLIGISTILNMFTFKLILLIMLGLFINKFWQTKKRPATFEPESAEQRNGNPEQIQRKSLFFKNSFSGNDQSTRQVYEWEDINIQSGFGDIVIDLSNTVLPSGENFISVRNIAGTIRVLVPYEMEVMVLHSVIYGSVSILDNQDQRAFNETVQYHTALYDESSHKIKILTATVAGKLEVKRI